MIFKTTGIFKDTVARGLTKQTAGIFEATGARDLNRYSSRVQIY